MNNVLVVRYRKYRYRCSFPSSCALDGAVATVDHGLPYRYTGTTVRTVRTNAAEDCPVCALRCRTVASVLPPQPHLGEHGTITTVRYHTVLYVVCEYYCT